MTLIDVPPLANVSHANAKIELKRYIFEMYLKISVTYIYTQAQCNFSSEELHWVSHGVVGGKCQYFT